MPPAKPAAHDTSKSAPVSSEPKSADKAVIDGKPHIWIPGFGWIEDHGGGNVGTFAADMYENGNKIGIMGSGTTVGGKGDINKQVGFMGDEKHPPSETTPPASGQLEPVEGEIVIEFNEVPEKDSTPPPYKPATTPPTNP